MTTANPAYRDANEGARIHYQDLLVRRAGAQEALTGAIIVRGARLGRIAAGATGLGAFVTLAASAAYSYLDRGHGPGLPLTGILLAAWPAMALAYVCGRVDVWSALGSLVRKTRELDDLQARIARLEEDPPVEGERLRADRLERASIALPMSAVALLAPLTIHYAFWRMGHDDTTGFDWWIALSLLIVGHAHLTLAYRCCRFAREVRETRSDQLPGLRAEHEWTAYGLAVLASAIPGALLYLIPPVLTIVTGLCFNPLMFRGMTRALCNERRLLDAAEPLA